MEGKKWKWPLNERKVRVLAQMCHISGMLRKFLWPAAAANCLKYPRPLSSLTTAHYTTVKTQNWRHSAALQRAGGTNTLHRLLKEKMIVAIINGRCQISIDTKRRRRHQNTHSKIRFHRRCHPGSSIAPHKTNLLWCTWRQRLWPHSANGRQREPLQRNNTPTTMKKCR